MIKDKIKPPYIAKIWIANAFDKFSKINLGKIDSKTIKTYCISSPGNESKVINALKFLNIIDDAGKTNPEIYKIFAYSSEEKKKEELQILIKNLYKGLFEEVNIDKINNDELKDFFVMKYDYSKVQAEGAARFFVYISDFAGIPLPEKLKEYNRDTIKKNKKYSSGKKEKRKKKKENTERVQIEESNYAKVLFLTNEGVRLEFPINSKENWEDAKSTIKIRIDRQFNNQGLEKKSSDEKI